jgi:tetratricopeptide (TPR) repeat protein
VQGDLARTLYNRGLLLFQTGAVEDAREDFDRAVQLLSLAAGADPGEPLFRQGLARCHINLGILDRDQKKPVDALQHYGQAISLLEDLVRESPGKEMYGFELAQAQMNRGNLLLVSRNEVAIVQQDPIAAAQASFNEAIRNLDLLARSYPNVPDYRIQLANSLNGLGGVHQAADRPEDARAAWEQARDEFMRLLHDVGPSADVHSRLGLTLANLARLEAPDRPLDRIASLRDAWNHQRQAQQLNPASTSIASYLRRHGAALTTAYLLAGDHEAAVQQAEETVRIPGSGADDWHRAAQWITEAAAKCQQDARLESEQRDQRVDDYGRRAVAALRMATGGGELTPSELSQDSAFAILRPRADFQELLVGSGKN